MSDVSLEIRNAIFAKFNSDERFTNDQIFAELQNTNKIEKSLTIDDMEQYFTNLCDAGIMRNIAQNFTTQWFKLFDPLEKVTCPACKAEIPVNKSEEKNCPLCNAAI
ncbi:MAG: hypothetical protein FJ357_05700 [Thaumarchaeota archaeon]|nr:hypothetical protein [Nitrososphaerota archaeon]